MNQSREHIDRHGEAPSTTMQNILQLANGARFAVCLLLITFPFLFGCTSTPTPDPLAGWKAVLDKKPSEAIVKDYHDYIHALPAKIAYNVLESNIQYLQDGSGQHAIMIEIPYDGVYLEHVLVYDRDDKRIKVIKYTSGRYAS